MDLGGVFHFIQLVGILVQEIVRFSDAFLFLVVGSDHESDEAAFQVAPSFGFLTEVSVIVL